MEDWDVTPGDALVEKILTDDGDFINQAAFTYLTFNLKLATQPTAVQGHIAGNKDLWIIHPTNNAGLKPKICICKSQHKMDHIKPYEKSYRVFDVISCGNPPRTVSLSLQSITIFLYNRISLKVVKQLMKEEIEQEVKPLMVGSKTEPLAPLKI